MRGEGFRGGGLPDTAHSAGCSVLLPSSQVVVRVVEDRGSVFLDVHSRLDSASSCLLGLSHRPVLEGLASFTPIGRWHALCWGLAFGTGRLPERALVHFESGTLRHPRSAVAAVCRLGHDCWVADAEGVFSTAVLLVAGHEVARTILAQGQGAVVCAVLKPPSPLRRHWPTRDTDAHPGPVASRRQN